MAKPVLLHASPVQNEYNKNSLRMHPRENRPNLQIRWIQKMLLKVNPREKKRENSKKKKKKRWIQRSLFKMNPREKGSIYRQKWIWEMLAQSESRRNRSNIKQGEYKKCLLKMDPGEGKKHSYRQTRWIREKFAKDERRKNVHITNQGEYKRSSPKMNIRPRLANQGLCRIFEEIVSAR